MNIAKFISPGDQSVRIGVVEKETVAPLRSTFEGRETTISDVLHAADPAGFATDSIDRTAAKLPLAEVRLLAPIDLQEVWGAGVTYERSKTARREESEQGGSFYDLVYTADRPELFFKATPSRVVGPGGAVRVRRDTKWSVPEPELTLVVSPTLELVGFTIGNDMSARDIEGRNPLYLPQAKVYAECCGIGPWITLAKGARPMESTTIDLTIERGGVEIVRDSTSLTKMRRSFQELIEWLGRDNVFPNGVLLMTGTGIVPADEFSLEAGDTIAIAIDGIGVLRQSVVRGG
jgi:2-dehydro-3-deoxy-D-arabinonate dehydratase